MSAFQDLTGQTFGYLTVESYAGKKGKRTAWNCRCVCGNTTIVTGTHLKTGHTTSCGCKHFDKSIEDLSGQQFGYWTVIEHTGFKKGQTMWKCQCICGTIREVRAGALKSGKSSSCGCMNQVLFKERGYIRKGSKKITDLTGQRFGRLTVISLMPHEKGEPVFWKCKCDCGNERTVNVVNLNNGTATQCLECNKPFSYRQNYPRLGTIWGGLRDRCNNPNNPRYPDYGGRNITVCKEWDSLENFVEWAITHGYKDGLTIDRIDNEKGYSPDNCRWATLKEQANNTRKNVFLTYKGETHSLSVWSEITGISRSTLNYRYSHWDNVEDILQKPPNVRNRTNKVAE